MAFFTDGKGKRADNPDSLIWYHGSPFVLEMLAAGDSITRNRDIAVAFSHKPTQLSIDDDGTVRHNGQANGYLYRVDEPVTPDEFHVHPDIRQDDPWECTTQKPFRLKLLKQTSLH